MTSLIRRLASSVTVLWLMAPSILMPGAAQAQSADPLAPLPTRPPAALPSQQIVAVPVAPRTASPAQLRSDVEGMARRFNGKAGIAIVNLAEGWNVEWNAARLFPQQSCSKLWVAITALDQVDRGRVALTDRVTLRRDDLTLFHQPLAAKVLGGGHTSTLGALLHTAVTESDNTANDKLMRSIGGPQTVRDTIERKGLGAIRFFDGERSLQSKIAGLTWSQSYSIGDAFYKARSALPMSLRRASFNRYIEDPYDGASPRAVAAALARLKRGELLSPSSTARLLSIMGQTRTGKARVRAALPTGWSWSHKTGTGQVLDGRIGGINDIGLLTAPDGTVYAMALMTVPNTSNGDAQGLMQAVTKAIVANHRARAR